MAGKVEAAKSRIGRFADGGLSGRLASRVADVTAGYSGTPLAKKLGITAGAVVAVIDEPDRFRGDLAPIPSGVVFRSSLRGKPGIVVLFVTDRAPLSNSCQRHLSGRRYLGCLAETSVEGAHRHDRGRGARDCFAGRARRQQSVCNRRHLVRAPRRVARREPPRPDSAPYLGVKAGRVAIGGRRGDAVTPGALSRRRTARAGEDPR